MKDFLKGLFEDASIFTGTSKRSLILMAPEVNLFDVNIGDVTDTTSPLFITPFV